MTAITEITPEMYAEKYHFSFLKELKGDEAVRSSISGFYDDAIWAIDCEKDRRKEKTYVPQTNS